MVEVSSMIWTKSFWIRPQENKTVYILFGVSGRSLIYVLHSFLSFVTGQWTSVFNILSHTFKRTVHFTFNLVPGSPLAGYKRRSPWCVHTFLCWLAPGRFQGNFRYSNFKLNFIHGWSISGYITLRWMSLDLPDNNARLDQVMSWSHQVTIPSPEPVLTQSYVTICHY